MEIQKKERSMIVLPVIIKQNSIKILNVVIKN